ncbi:MAG: hypothetical protein QOD84_2678 [Acidobacteriaceae bacterium]|jgi:hypothetical protein
MPTDTNKALRKQLVSMLKGGEAHAKFEDVISDLPAGLRGMKPAGFPHSPWMLLEHLRITQWDILEFSRNAKHKSPKWPDEYWSKTVAPPGAAAWDKIVTTFKQDAQALQDLIASSSTDLFQKIPWGDGQTILREALLLADHNAYHIAQLVDVRRLLGAWKEK